MFWHEQEANGYQKLRGQSFLRAKHCQLQLNPYDQNFALRSVNRSVAARIEARVGTCKAFPARSVS